MSLTRAEIQRNYRARQAQSQLSLLERLATLEAQGTSRPAVAPSAPPVQDEGEDLPEDLCRALEAKGLVYTPSLRDQALWHYLAHPPAPPDDPSRQEGALAEQILAQFGDGKYHLVRTMAAAVQAEMAVVRAVCNRIVDEGLCQTFAERRPAAPAQGGFAYRFVKGGMKTVNLAALYAELQPVLDDMKKVIHGHHVHFSQQAMKMSFAQVEKVIERVAR